MKVEKRKSDDTGDTYWVWVADQQSYTDAEGNDDPDLDPKNKRSRYLTWTCHKDTKRGDLVILYRSRLKKDLAYLLRVTGDAELSTNAHNRNIGWNYWCNCEVLFKFEAPIPLSVIKADPYLENWTALRGNFQRMVYRIPDTEWKRLNQIIAKQNRDYRTFLSGIKGAITPDPRDNEKAIESKLVKDLRLFKKFGFDLELCSLEEDGYHGRQTICDGGHGGRIDLLCYDKKRERYVVIEIKNVRASQITYGQIKTYLGWVRTTLKHKKLPVGIVVGRGYDAKFEASMADDNRVRFIDLSELGIK